MVEVQTRARAKDKELVVARGVIHEQPAIEPEDLPEEIRASVGRRLTLKLPFRFDEASPEEETYRFAIHAAVGGMERADEARFKDRWGVTDAGMGFVSVVFDNLPAGTHEVSVDCVAEYGVGKWGSHDEAVYTAKETVTFTLSVA